MPEVLSQAEIDSLLTAVSTGKVEGTASADTGSKNEDRADTKNQNWIAYDLTSHEKIVRNKLVALQSIHERFSDCSVPRWGSI
ncbi:hypothetical protein EBQ90_10350 [bacterium]|nr:hypothetical protein [bacterium]